MKRSRPYVDGTFIMGLISRPFPTVSEQAWVKYQEVARRLL